MAWEKMGSAITENERTVTGMAEYIEREALRDALYDADAITMSGVKILNQFPAANVAPVRHGRSMYASGSGKYFCSSCDEYALSFKKDTLYGGDLYEVCLTDYCPNCGAVMEDANA